MQLFFFFSCLADLLILLYVITKACSREQIIKGLREIPMETCNIKFLWNGFGAMINILQNILITLEAVLTQL